ncbi:hypothetical protein Cpir12675_005312 [Ceratocystis pirilliformis]|uniref:Uncharacterized protein n=1 Tax=Ceratocystis pirilliformis TaxID=259994 RepID=A0ABR3YQF0_9PEZI
MENEKAPRDLQNFAQDAHRVVLCHGGIVEVAPLQVYARALIFSPTNSLMRQQYCHEEPSWIQLKPKVEADWNLCLRTLEGHVDKVASAVFSHDGRQLASGSSDEALKV